MSRTDVLKSLLRSTALGARDGLRKLPASGPLMRALVDASAGRAAILDAQLSADVARVTGVTAATVHTDASALHVQANFDDGAELSLRLRPAGVMFAAGGAKEVAFSAEPDAIADSGRGRDVVSAVAGAIARKLWAPALAGAPRSAEGAPVSRQAGRLYLDLRSVPEVRWALGRRMPAALIEALALRAISLEPGRLTLAIVLPALEQFQRRPFR